MSVRWARADARLRGLSLEEALAARAEAFVRLPALRTLWTSSIVEIHDGERYRPAVEVAARAGGPLVVLSAENPLAIELDPEQNRARNALLRAELADPMPAVGRAAHGAWEEHGFAVPMTAAALEVAMSFAQLAVFRVEQGSLGLIELVGIGPQELRSVI